MGLLKTKKKTLSGRKETPNKGKVLPSRRCIRVTETYGEGGEEERRRLGFFFFFFAYRVDLNGLKKTRVATKTGAFGTKSCNNYYSCYSCSTRDCFRQKISEHL